MFIFNFNLKLSLRIPAHMDFVFPKTHQKGLQKTTSVKKKKKNDEIATSNSKKVWNSLLLLYSLTNLQLIEIQKSNLNRCRNVYTFQID